MRPNPFGLALHTDSLTGILILLAPAWLLLIVTSVFLHVAVLFKASLPRIFRDVLEYGKVKQKPQKKVILDLIIPKRFFTHFYVWGTICIWSLTLVFFYHCIPSSIPSWRTIVMLEDMITFVTGGYFQRCSVLTRHHIDVAIVLSMLSIQVIRRLYESLFVSIFSSGARIHLAHYLLGLFFYPAAAFTALLHLDAADEQKEQNFFLWSRWFTYVHYCVMIILFLWGSLHQHRCHKILAALRRDKTDNSYKLPRGDWFDLVSSPHYLAEVVIYTSMFLILVVTDVWTVWWLVVTYIISTLGISARQTHSWYKNKFEDYPRNRRAMIPWLI